MTWSFPFTFDALQIARKKTELAFLFRVCGFGIDCKALRLTPMQALAKITTHASVWPALWYQTCAAILSCLARGLLSGFESHRADVITFSEHGWTVDKSGATISPRTWKVGSHLFRRTWHDLSFCYSLATTTESVISTIWLLPIGISFSFTSRCMNSGSKLNTNNQIRRSRLQRHRLFPSPIITFNLDWSGCALKLKPAFPSSSKAHRYHCILFYFHIVCMQGIALASRGV
jgi:hypothetical protein